MFRKSKQKTGPEEQHEDPGAASSVQDSLTDEGIKRMCGFLDKRIETQSKRKKLNEQDKVKQENYGPIKKALEIFLNDRKSRTGGDGAEAQGEIQALELERDEEKKKVAALQQQAEERQDRIAALEQENSQLKGIRVILPQESHDDSRVKPVWGELMARLRRRQIELDVEVKVGKIIEQKDGLVILPCICTSRVGIEIAAALEEANMKKEIKLVIIIFNHLADHCNTINVKTREHLSDRSVLERCHLMVDAVYWEGKMSDCKVNDELMSELGSLLKQM